MDERPLAVGHSGEKGESQPSLEKTDKAAAAPVRDIIKKLLTAAADQKGFLIHQIFYIHHQLVGIRMGDD